MPRSLGRCMHASFSCGLTYCLASVLIVIRMIVTPLPIRSLILHSHLRKWPILSVSLAEVYPIGMVFVVIPIVIVPVVAVVEPVAVIVVTPVLFLPSIVLRLGRGTHCCWSSKGGRQKKGAEKISITTVHLVFLLAQEFNVGMLGPHRVCICNRAEDVQYRTFAQVIRIASRPQQDSRYEPGRSRQEPLPAPTAFDRLSFIAYRAQSAAYSKVPMVSASFG